MSLRLRLLESSGRAAVRLAPAPVREQWGEDLHTTFRDACMQRNGVSELFDLVRASLRARFARPMPITGGVPPRLPGRKPMPMQTLANDVRMAVRSLMASRVQSGIAILTLALGIG